VARSPGAPCTPCGAAGACDDGNPCTADACQADGTCGHDAFCCFEAATWAAGFEAGLGGWFLEDTDATDGVTWQVAAGPAGGDGQAAWLGDPATGTYAGTGPVRVGLRSPSVTVPPPVAAGGAPGVGFALHLTTEWTEQPTYDNPGGLDRLSLEVVSAGSGVEIWSSDELEGSSDGAWVPVEVDLTAWSGKLVQLRFLFDSGDDGANGYAGPFLDDVRVGTFCP
jgi:hypothetical protein